MRTFLFCFVFIFSLPLWASNDELLEKVVTRAHQTDSSTLLILQNGKRVFAYGSLYTVHNVQSVTKSVISLGLMQLIEDRKISLGDPMSRWIPEWKSHPIKSRITLKMLMNHTSGLPKCEPNFFETPDIIARGIGTELESLPGERFHYSNIGATLLQRVIEQASGTSVENYVNEHVLLPMGITDEKWQRDYRGHERTSGGLELSTIDLLKFGQYMLDREEACDELLLTKSQPFAEYGLLWWLYGDSFYAKGWGGQFVFINRAKGLIAIRTKDPKTVDWEKLEDQYFHDFVSLMSTWQ